MALVFLVNFYLLAQSLAYACVFFFYKTSIYLLYTKTPSTFFVSYFWRRTKSLSKLFNFFATPRTTSTKIAILICCLPKRGFSRSSKRACKNQVLFVFAFQSFWCSFFFFLADVIVLLCLSLHIFDLFGLRKESLFEKTTAKRHET